MLDPPSMARLKQLMTKYKKQKPTFVSDNRPVSGMVGQSCQGFIQDENGELIRIVYDNNNDQIGPGSYNPIYQNQKHKLPIKIQDSSHQSFKDNTNRIPSPGKYIPFNDDKRLPHLIAYGTHHSKYTGDGPTIAHPSWLPKQLIDINNKSDLKKFRLSHPSFDYHTQLSTFQFSSSTRRDLFPKRFISPSPVLHAKQAPPVEFDPSYNSPVFADKTDRFKVIDQSTPSPTAYTISDSFGKGPTKIISSPNENDSLHKFTGSCFDNQSNYVKINDKRNPYQPTPDSAMYAGPVIKTVDTSHHSPQFEDKVDRFKKITSDTPPPAFYNVNRNPVIIAPLQHKIRSRSSLPSESWYKSNSSDAPPVGSYSPKFDKSSSKKGYISSIGRKSFESKEDCPLAFRTMHSSFLKKSYNANYMNAAYNY